MDQRAEGMEQYDYVWDDFLKKAWSRYASVIGSFVLEFSLLEHTLNRAIADSISDRGHHSGYVILEKLTMLNKIDLFYRMHLLFQEDPKEKKFLAAINKELRELNSFRNLLAHANWATVSEDYYVRSRFTMDEDGGGIKFKKFKIPPALIRKNATRINRLIGKIEKGFII